MEDSKNIIDTLMLTVGKRLDEEFKVSYYMGNTSGIGMSAEDVVSNSLNRNLYNTLLCHKCIREDYLAAGLSEGGRKEILSKLLLSYGLLLCLHGNVSWVGSIEKDKLYINRSDDNKKIDNEFEIVEATRCFLEDFGCDSLETVNSEITDIFKQVTHKLLTYSSNVDIESIRDRLLKLDECYINNLKENIDLNSIDLVPLNLHRDRLVLNLYSDYLNKSKVYCMSLELYAEIAKGTYVNPDSSKLYTGEQLLLGKVYKELENRDK